MAQQTDISNSIFFDKDYKPQLPYDYNEELNGLGGWLIVFIIARFLTIINALIGIVDASDLIGYVPWVDTWLYIAIAVTVIFDIGLSVAILFYIFKRNILFRILFIVQISSTVLFIAIFSIALGYYFESILGTIGTAIGIAIWTAYVFKSVRVKNTFIFAHMSEEELAEYAAKEYEKIK